MPVNPLEHETDKGVHFDVTHRHNLGVLLRLTHKYGTVSRSQLSRDLELNRSTIHALIQELSAANLFYSPGAQIKPLPGRPSLMIQINPSFFTLAFALTGNSLTSAEVHLGDPVAVKRVEVISLNRDAPNGIVDSIVERVTNSLDDADTAAYLLAVAISVPGEVTQPGGVVTSLALGWDEFPLKQRLRDRLPSKLHIDVGTEADVGALAEKSFGGAKDLQNFAFLSGVSELSAGLVVNGALLTGKAGGAGRLNRLTVATNLIKQTGEGLSSIQALIGHDALLSRLNQLGFESIADFYASEDYAKKRELQQEVTSIVTSLLQNLIALLGVEKIFLDLELANYWSEICGNDIEQINDNFNSVESIIVRSSLGTDVALLGLGELGFEMLFENPELYFSDATRTY